MNGGLRLVNKIVNKKKRSNYFKAISLFRVVYWVILIVRSIYLCVAYCSSFNKNNFVKFPYVQVWKGSMLADQGGKKEWERNFSNVIGILSKSVKSNQKVPDSIQFVASGVHGIRNFIA